MLSKYMVQSLQDLALEQLPGTKALSKKLYIEHGNSRAALQAVAWAPTLLINSPISTSLEVLAGRLLALVGQHPCTHTEYLIEKMEGDNGLCISVENAVLWAEQDRPYIEEALLETARQLCEISGANLPPWMNAIDGQFAQQHNTVTPVPVVAVDASRGVERDKPEPVHKGWVMKKAALIDKHACHWATIQGDFHSASENGLSETAKAPVHGEWFEAAALNWANQRGKLKKEKKQGPANLATVWTSTKHTMEG